MYTTLAMLKPGATLAMREIAEIVEAACEIASHGLDENENGLMIRSEGCTLHVSLEHGDDVAIESDEIATRYALPCKGSNRRLSIWADDDPDMDLFNHWLILVEGLKKTGNFVLFDPEGGKAI